MFVCVNKDNSNDTFKHHMSQPGRISPLLTDSLRQIIETFGHS